MVSVPCGGGLTGRYISVWSGMWMVLCELEAYTGIPLSGGNDGSAKNLQACTGECDADSQCAAGLKCFQRSNSETIPGCTGAGSGKDWDYCYDPKWQPMTGGVMNSAQARKWKTSDGSPWWLRSRASREPNGNYYANCYMGLKHGKAWEANDFSNLKFDADKCKYHSASYYCQHIKTVSTTPKSGSPAGCSCKVLELTGKYSAGALLKCENCLEVSKSTQKNSCPAGTKLWAPRNRDDWKTFLASGLSSLRAPNWIVDVTRPVNGPGCCGWSAKNYNFNSGEAQQSAWKTADGAPWWLRSSKYNEPNGDYKANCYLDLWRNPSTADDVQWNDGNCNYHSKSYYCQPEKGAAPKTTPPPPTPAPALPAEAECAGLSGTSCPGVSGWHSTISLKPGDATQMCISKVASTGGTDCNSWCKKGGLDCLRAQDNTGSGCGLDGNHKRKTTANNGCSQTWGNQICQCGKKR